MVPSSFENAVDVPWARKHRAPSTPPLGVRFRKGRTLPKGRFGALPLFRSIERFLAIAKDEIRRGESPAMCMPSLARMQVLPIRLQRGAAGRESGSGSELARARERGTLSAAASEPLRRLSRWCGPDLLDRHRGPRNRLPPVSSSSFVATFREHEIDGH